MEILLYSYKGQEPKELPFKIRLNDGTTRACLNELSSKQLNDLGFIGPIKKPKYNEKTHKIKWDGENYQILNLNEDEKEKNKIDKKPDYGLFWEKLIETSVYKKIRKQSLKCIIKNTIYIELLFLFSEAKLGFSNEILIQKYINILFLFFELNDSNIREFNIYVKMCDLNLIYIVPNKDYIFSNVYDPESNNILTLPPFKSWKLIEGRWKPPISYPNDKKVYKWNEEEYELDNTKGWVLNKFRTVPED